MKPTKPAFLTLLLPVMVSIQNCSPAEEIVNCPAVFTIHYVTVLNPNEEPVDSVQIQVVKKDSKRKYEVCLGNICDGASYEAGRYIIMHDGLKEEISRKGELVLVVGTKGELTFTADYKFRRGICSVEKLAGSDTVSMEYN